MSLTSTLRLLGSHALNKLKGSETPTAVDAMGGPLEVALQGARNSLSGLLGLMAGSTPLLVSGCNDNGLSTAPEAQGPWTENCEAALNGFRPKDADDPNTEEDESRIGRNTPFWGSEALKFSAYEIGQVDAEATGDAASDATLQIRECLVAQAFYLAGQQRCAGDGTAAAITGFPTYGPNGEIADVDVQRDEFGNQRGSYPGGGCRPNTGFDYSGFKLPLVVQTNWSEPIELTLSFMPGGEPEDNIPNSTTPSLPDDGKHNWAGDYKVATDDEGDPVEYYDDWGNLMTAAPWFGVGIPMINGSGDRGTAVLEWCVQPDGRVEQILSDYTNGNGCVIPPRNSDATTEEDAS